MRHTIAYSDSHTFAAWPANSGLWAWADGEILTGCVTGRYIAQEGHNLAEPYTQRLLRTLDGGETWAVETPANFVLPGVPPRPLDSALDFTHPGFALRVAGTGYHGSEEPGGAFYTSHDRGKTWDGPFVFTGLARVPELAGKDLTPRTDMIALSRREALFCLSRREPGWGTDRVFCAATSDGGLTFTWRGWMVPPTDPHRAVMPATLRLPDGGLVSAVRRRSLSEEVCWIDAYGSDDFGASWRWLGKVGDTGAWNGNPPALACLTDGRLCCVFGDRSRRVMAARFSADNGRTWDDEMILRDDFYAEDGEPDFGYPRLAALPSGELLAVYYWATRERPQQHIAATSW